MSQRKKPVVGEVVAFETVPDENGRYANAKKMRVTLELPITAADVFPLGHLVACTKAERSP